MASFKTDKAVLSITSISLLLTMSVWFSANAVKDQLENLWNLSDIDLAVLSSIIIIGFVLGGLIFSIFNLPDIIRTKNFYTLSAIIASTANLLSALSPNFIFIIITRFITGFFLAGVYPVGMKLTVSWFKEKRGLAVGILLGALTAGSGLPFIFNLTGLPDWRLLVSLSSLQGLLGAIIVYLFVTEGPYTGKKAEFRFSNIKTIFSQRSLRFANYGYFGHMWELYAFWVWIPTFLQQVWRNVNGSNSDSLVYFSIGTFLIFFFGAFANAIGGGISDKIGRTTFSIIALVISGFSSLIIGFFVNDVLLALVVAIIWGIAVIPDSPQYSTMISELCDPSYTGTALTIQTAVGFGLTIVTIQLLPIVVDNVGWSLAFIVLSIGPIFGIISLFRLRREPDAIKIALGNK